MLAMTMVVVAMFSVHMWLGLVDMIAIFSMDMGGFFLGSFFLYIFYLSIFFF
jgi:hypothetical protein